MREFRGVIEFDYNEFRVGTSGVARLEDSVK